MATQRNRRNTLYGYPQPQTGLQQEPIVSDRDPLSSDGAEVGTIWVNQTSHSFFILTASLAGVNTWTSTTGGATTLTSLTVDPGNIVVEAGDVNIIIGNLNMAPASSANLGDTATADLGVGGDFFVNGNATLNADVLVNGDTDMVGSLDVTGNVVVNGDFDLSSASAISFTTTSNTAPAISFVTNGGSAETIFIQSNQGTSPTAIQIVSLLGGVAVSGGLPASDALHFTAFDPAGGMLFGAGTNGYLLQAVNGRFQVETGTGPINIGTDIAAKLITIGNATGITGVNVNTGTGGFKLNALADIDITGSDAFNVVAGTIISLNSTGSAINIGTNNTIAQNISIGTGASARVIAIGNNIGATSLSLVSGTGNIAASSAGTITLGSAGALSINSSGGVINIGNDAIAQNINIGTAGARTITMGNITGATAISLNVGTGALNLGTGATAHATAIGSTVATSTLTLNTPAGTNVAATNGLSVTAAGRGLSLPGGLLVVSGAGSPSGVVAAPIGSLYLNSTAASAVTRAYINTDGGTVWTNITCAA